MGGRGADGRVQKRLQEVGSLLGYLTAGGGGGGVRGGHCTRKRHHGVGQSPQQHAVPELPLRCVMDEGSP